jgi:hypothetical protein
MDQAALGQLEQQIGEEVSRRFPGAVRRVAVLQYGDDPVIEPGGLLVRVILEVAEGAEGSEGQRQALKAFQAAHGPAIRQFRNELCAQHPEIQRVEIRTSDTGKGPQMMLGGREDGGELTPVMARLGPVDLETLDALITAGIASSRAEAVRWALAHIRERPAYAQLRERAQEIERLKTEF